MATILFRRAEMFALYAAVMNGTIGVLTRYGFQQEATSSQLAFWKCFGAFLVILMLCIFRSDSRTQLIVLSKKWPYFATLAFLGIFCLYFFETRAFEEASIPLVSFLTYAAGALTLILSAVFLGEKFSSTKLLAFAAIIVGVYFIFNFEVEGSGNYLGVIFALLGGLGYALFIFFSKVFRIGGGLPHLAWLFGFGSLYLLVPLIIEGGGASSGGTLLVVIALIFVPTIGGFYCTTKAVAIGKASNVQIIETSDPLFASLFGLILFGDTMGMPGYIGAACIMVGLILAVKLEPSSKGILTAK